MPIRYVNRYDPAFCRANPDWLVVFGDNLARTGRGGQAVIRYEPNAIGIPTKRRPSMEEGSFFSDGDLPTYLDARAHDLYRLQRHLAGGGTVVLPADGLGTNRARLRSSAPAVWAQLQEDLAALRATPTITQGE